jgi:hypothetical protein
MDLDALLEEHRRLPYGPHSDELGRLLTYFRRGETSGKYVIYSRSDGEGWQIGRLDARADQPRIDLDPAVYTSSALAQQAVLEARVRSLEHGEEHAP